MNESCEKHDFAKQPESPSSQLEQAVQVAEPWFEKESDAHCEQLEAPAPL